MARLLSMARYKSRGCFFPGHIGPYLEWAMDELFKILHDLHKLDNNYIVEYLSPVWERSLSTYALGEFVHGKIGKYDNLTEIN